MRILVTGAAGQLGGTIAASWAGAHDLVPLGRAGLDVTDHRAVQRVVADVAPDAIVNCVAYTQVDEAERAAVASLEVNAFAVRSLARAAEDGGAVLVHYSTDFVFDGEASEPYGEEDAPNPRSVYASSKLVGEWFAACAPRAYVLRVESLFGGPHARSSIDRILDAIAAGDETQVFVDRTVSPSYVVDVAAATLALLERRLPYGLYHCVNDGFATWDAVALEAARLMRREPRLVRQRFAETRLPAPRPRFCALSNQKLRDAGFAMPHWTDALARHVAARFA
jgi:dTDP-4-dehydrorhamnose reductase